jgi:gluconolactonase
MKPVFSIEQSRILYDGTVTEPRLLHPESVAIDSNGNVWCGGELGQIYRISADGSTLEECASTGGFTLGIAFDDAGMLYTCDLKHKCVFRYDPARDELEMFAKGTDGVSLRVPNWPVVDLRRRVLYVSDSFDPQKPGPGIWRFDLDTGKGMLWYDKPLTFANGMALTADGNALFVAETFGRRISRIAIRPDGSPGERETVVELDNTLPDGLALDQSGNLYIACYEPSHILRFRPDGELETLLADPEAHTLCHPTNCAFRGGELLIANLGRWHITSLHTDAQGLPLPVRPSPSSLT